MYCSSESCFGACMQHHGPEATNVRRPVCSSGGSSSSRANCSAISASSSKRGLCGPCPTEADICRRRCKVDVLLFRVRVVERCLC